MINVTKTVHEHHEHHHHVTEKRAPTDESVRLLREMEAEAQAAIIASVRVENTHIDMVCHKTYDLINDRTLYRMVYQLNGVKRTVVTHVNTGGPVEPHLLNTLSDDIASALLSKAEFKWA